MTQKLIIGISGASDLDLLPPAVSPVLGTETASLSLIKEASRRANSGGQRAVVSIDMRNGKLLASDPDLAYSAADGYLYVAFEENTSGWPQIYVKRKGLTP